MKASVIVRSIRSPEDVLIFSSIEAAERYLEPLDVLAGEYVAYDSEGRLLDLTAKDDFAKVSIRPAERDPSHVDELREVLLRLLSSTDRKKGSLQQWDIAMLVRCAQRYKTE